MSFPAVVYLFTANPHICFPLLIGAVKEMDDLLERGDSTRVFFTPALEPWELDAYCEDETVVPEVCIACIDSVKVSSHMLYHTLAEQIFETKVEPNFRSTSIRIYFSH